MRVLVLTAGEIRHQYFINKVQENFELVGVIKQPKRKYYKNSLYETDFMKRHFSLLLKAEMKWLGVESRNNKNEYDQYETEDINSVKTLEWAKDKNPDIILLFGTRVLDKVWMDVFGNIVNLHLGLSPNYRGSATLFWPFVNKELNCIGVTFHLTEENVDSGPILDRVRPPILVGDSYYDINYKAIKAGIDSMPNVVFNYMNGNIKSKSQIQVPNNRTYKKKHFNEKVLKQALEYIGDGITEGHIKDMKKSLKCKF
jgi:methionyl-tRNA formyltransferase